LDRGILREDIVLAYHSPFMRQYDGFAVSWLTVDFLCMMPI
jgi:hypothetical protein